jgi:cystathionine beta-lyase/cystathionine gamma-synthase
MDEDNRFPLVPEVDVSTAYGFHSSESLASYHRKPRFGLRYSRDASAASQALESYFETMYPGFYALTFSSGMAAITTAMSAFSTSARTLFLQHETYRKNRFLAKNLYPSLWNSVETFDAFEIPITHGLKNQSFFLEAPSNPHLRIPLVADIKNHAGDDGMVFVDATLSGIGNEQPLLLDNSDVIIHSLTKYANGYNDSFGGLVLVREKLIDALWEYRSAFGTILNPRDAWNIHNHLKSYRVRFDRQVRNTMGVLDALNKMKAEGRILKFFYPGSGENIDQNEIASTYLKSPGAVVSFIPHASLAELEARIGELKVLKMAPSFGSVDSLFEFPRTMSLASLSDDELERLGIAINLIRVAVGIEDQEAIIADILKLATGVSAV